MLVDKQGRELNYLRLAVTDKCNLRCRYCMPEEGISFLPKSDLLTFEEITRLTGLLSKNGVTKVRLTGGEPFVRPDMPELLETIGPWFRSINITTNATLIGQHIDLLKRSNIGSLNISLDSLDRNRFLAITKRDLFDKVWQTIQKAYDAGIWIKINAVIMDGINDMEIPEFLKLSRDRDIEVRFIEAMPFNGYDHNKGLFLDHQAILERIQEIYPDVRLSPKVPMKSASIKYEIPGFKGGVGIIPAYSRTLCASCNRIRITAKGELLNCLYATNGLDLRPMLRGGANDDEIISAIQGHIVNKPVDGFEAERQSGHLFNSMTTIGG